MQSITVNALSIIHFENSAAIATEALVMQILTESSMKSLIHEKGPDFAFLKPHWEPVAFWSTLIRQNSPPRHPWNPRQNASPAAAMGPRQAIGSLVQRGEWKLDHD